MEHVNNKLGDILKNTKVIPVITIQNIEQALPIAKAFVAGGINVLEITLRTDCALDAIKEIIDNIPNICIGAGTVNNPNLFEKSYKAGCKFAVSPGYTDSLINIANEIPMPYLPGIATPSEAMQLADFGYKYLKMFPAEAINARNLLKSIYAPLPALRFCPTGGISFDLAQEYLQTPNVICVGGSWLMPKDSIANNQWSDITSLAKQTKSL